MDYTLLRKKIVSLLNVKKSVRQELLIYDYSKAAFESREMGIVPEIQTGKEVVISLTTYSKRIEQVHIVIESLFRQTRKVNKVLLWLSKDEFSNEEIPLILRKQQERGLEIHVCNDIKSYKKLLPTLKLYPESTIITVDDDYIYPIDFVERLLQTARQYPKSICYYVGNRISLNGKGKINPYIKWKSSEEEYSPSLFNFPTGAGGILYPPNSLYPDVVDETLCMQYAPSADDLWFKTMSVLKNTTCVKVSFRNGRFEDKFVLLEDMQDIALYHNNVGKGLNDISLKKLVEMYPIEAILKAELG